MSSKRISDKIKLFKESNIDHLVPWDIFIEKISDADSLLRFVEDEDAPKEIKQQACWHYVVMCISAMDTYFRGMAAIFIDGGWCKSTFYHSLKKEQISLSELVEADKEKLTIGEIIALTETFQDLNSINNFYSKLVGCDDFVLEVSKFKTNVGKDRFTTLKDKRSNFRNDIQELVRFRHLIIHHDTIKKTINTEKLDKLVDSFIEFIRSAEFFLAKVSEGYTEKQR
jgi:hypothetical protein